MRNMKIFKFIQIMTRFSRITTATEIARVNDRQTRPSQETSRTTNFQMSHRSSPLPRLQNPVPITNTSRQQQRHLSRPVPWRHIDILTVTPTSHAFSDHQLSRATWFCHAFQDRSLAVYIVND